MMNPKKIRIWQSDPICYKCHFAIEDWELSKTKLTKNDQLLCNRCQKKKYIKSTNYHKFGIGKSSRHRYRIKLFKIDPICKLCYNRIKYIDNSNLDHIIPRSKGGRNNKGNLQLVHITCNRKKGNKMSEINNQSKNKTPLVPIDISIETLIGCIDILEANGQPISDKTFSLIIQELLTAILLGYQKEGTIPIYETQNIIAQRFLEIVDQMGTINKTDKDYISDTNVESIIEESKRESEEQSRKDLESIKQPLEPIDRKHLIEESDGSITVLTLSDIPDTDELKQEAITDLQKDTLLLIYNKMSKDLWGSDTARTLWIQVLDRETSKKSQNQDQTQSSDNTG